ncbi:hypothetical protein [Pseudoduganella flava]|uniref:Uncharacterized protein n=1 Tax=Pseudoduganella flava TaxID=871742 RepID=A0ABX6FS95_9BURK|nr:hypothetical protein [Pseudoduganella flava]QGZ39397.1 hypothetical protein GO485_10285 [Pseudoduganella flava]
MVLDAAMRRMRVATSKVHPNGEGLGSDPAGLTPGCAVGVKKAASGPQTQYLCGAAPFRHGEISHYKILFRILKKPKFTVRILTLRKSLDK